MNDSKWSRFETWLDTERGLDEGTIGNRISNCRRVEKFEGDLAAFFDADGLSGLLERLTYSTDDARHRRRPRHKIPINGDVRRGTATLKTAVRLYRDFRYSMLEDPAVGLKAPPRRRQVSRVRTKPESWPDWPQPSEAALLELAQILAPLVRFLDPEIVAAITGNNQQHRTEWSRRFREHGIDPEIYLWDGSPCAFPGVRRHAGSKEISDFRRQSAPDAFPPHCLAVDDNDYPKHLWAYVLTGRPFRKKGPDGYQLGHLVDHKEHGNRWREELTLLPGSDEPSLLFGLFTSAANAAYFPAAFLRPTDFSFRLRSLLQRRATSLYSSVCRILPPGLETKPCDDGSWQLGQFDWAPPVGPTTGLPAFLEFRHGRIEELFRTRDEGLRSGSSSPNPAV